jgi:hypothetical protein
MAIIKDVKFFIQCSENLRELYDNTDENRQRQLITMLKTWLFYNSSSKDIFWTGKSSRSVLNGGHTIVKEHWFGNLSSAEFILNPNVGHEDFFGLSKIEQFLKIFQFMQWNYATQKENQMLRNFQNPNRFYNEFNGNPNLIYNEARIDLVDVHPENNLLTQFERFFNNENYQEENNNSYVFEVTLSNNLLVTFCDALEAAENYFQIEVRKMKIGKKGMVFRINSRNSFASFYRITMFALWRCFSNQKQIQNFLVETNRVIGETGPYRYENNFDARFGNYAFPLTIVEGDLFNNTVWLWARYNDSEKYRLLSQILEFFDANLFIYDHNLNLLEF